MGYANEVGEAFRALVHVRWAKLANYDVHYGRLGRWVRASYGLASAYVLADTADKGGKQARQPGADTKAVAVAAVDTLLWQAFASVIVPGAPHSALLWARMPSLVALQVSL